MGAGNSIELTAESTDVELDAFIAQTVRKARDHDIVLREDDFGDHCWCYRDRLRTETEAE